MTLLLSLVLLVQGIPVSPSRSGVVTGVLRTAAGMPAAGIRVAAMAQPELQTEAAAGFAMASLAQTDEMGRYRLEDIPPGRYYVVAGRVDFPTYYPGALAMNRGTVVAVSAGGTVSGIDFTMQDASALALTGPPGIGIPVQVLTESGAKIPVFAAGKFPVVRLIRTDGLQMEAPLNAASITLAASSAQYRVSVENLPQDYVVRSLTFGAIDLSSNPLKMSALANFPPSANVEALLSSATTGPTTIPPVAVVTSTTPLSITLGIASSVDSTSSGVRVTGRARGALTQPVYISGIPGTLFSDGSFQFRGVLPGPHVVAMTADSGAPNQFGVSLAVGNKDMNGVELLDTPVLPADVLSPPARSANEAVPASIYSLVSLRGRVVSEATHQPIAGGSITVVGLSQKMYSLTKDGEFNIPQLLPGTYNLQVSIFDHFTLNQTIVVDHADVDIDLSIRPVGRSVVSPQSR